MAKCKTCGKTIEDRFQYCLNCRPSLSRERNNMEDANVKLPQGYLEKGYFDEDGYIYADLLGKTAENVARVFGVGKPKLTNSQLRRFYNHAVAAEERLNLTDKFKAANSSVQKLQAYAAEAVGKDKVPAVFLDFIKKNTNAVKDDKSLRQGFLEHFEAVVAYYYYLYPRN